MALPRTGAGVAAHRACAARAARHASTKPAASASSTSVTRSPRWAGLRDCAMRAPAAVVAMGSAYSGRSGLREEAHSSDQVQVAGRISDQAPAPRSGNRVSLEARAMDEPLVFSTCPQSKGADSDYLDRVAEISRWSEAAGCEGMLVYTDNSLVDPWLVAQVALQSTQRLCPLVAVQPVYMHPYSVARMVASLALMHGRRIYLNMLAGGFKNDLIALGDDTPHDDRYLRTVEYTKIVFGLLRGETVTFEGRYY